MTISSEPVSVPHLALPLELSPSGAFNTIEQDTEAEVAQSVEVLLGTAKGQRLVVPDYGVDDPTFANPDPNAITQSIAQWEPRALPTVTISTDSQGNSVVGVTVALANPAP